MSHLKSPLYQISLVMIGFVTLMLGLMLLYAFCVPDLDVSRHVWKKEFFDLCSYLLPCAAAICAGGGFFIKNPPAALAGSSDEQHGKGGEIEAASGMASGGVDSDFAAKFFYILSLPLLYAGILSYAFCHPCRSPAIVIVCGSFVWSILLLLFARYHAVVSPSRGDVVFRYVLKVLTLVVIVAIILTIFYWHTMFQSGMCID